LLGLLDRSTILKTQTILESLTGLLATVTRPIVTVAKNKKKQLNLEEPKQPSTEQPTRSSDIPSSDAPLLSTSPASQTNPNPAPASSTEVPESSKKEEPKEDEKSKSDEDPLSVLSAKPPQLPPHALRCVINILDAGECSSRTFQQFLALVLNLCYLPNIEDGQVSARDILVEELKRRVQEIGAKISEDLQELFGALKDAREDKSNKEVSSEKVRTITLSKFSPASSLQAKFLRILKTVDYIFTCEIIKKTNSLESPLNSAEKLQAEEIQVGEIFESFDFKNLWDRLGACLTEIEGEDSAKEEKKVVPETAEGSDRGNYEMIQVATVLLPLVESFMVVNKYAVLSAGLSKRTVT